MMITGASAHFEAAIWGQQRFEGSQDLAAGAICRLAPQRFGRGGDGSTSVAPAAIQLSHSEVLVPLLSLRAPHRCRCHIAAEYWMYANPWTHDVLRGGAFWRLESLSWVFVSFEHEAALLHTGYHKKIEVARRHPGEGG